MQIVAIDTHTHFNHGSSWDVIRDEKCHTACLEKLMKMYEVARVDKVFCSTYGSVLSAEGVEDGNDYLFRFTQEVDWLYQWVVIDPRNEKTFRQAEKMLNSGKCVGIKLHPVCHNYQLEQYGDKLFSFASQFNAIVQIHPEKEASYILPMANKYPDVTFIMAHLGDESYVDAIEYADHGNVYVDTSGMASWQNMIIEYAVDRVGSERILFGTDTYALGFQRGRIEYALISEQDKENILRYNAEKLFGLCR